MSETAKHTLTADYFEQVYAANDDPWNFATSEYEYAKYTQTLAALPRPKYANAFEIGCSIGVLTERLAGRCARLLSVDTSARALAQARTRCRHLPHVRFEQMDVGAEYPCGVFDLTILSEVGYYFALEDLRSLRARIVEHLAPGGHLLLVHWTPFVHDYPLTGDEVHKLFLELCDAKSDSHAAGEALNHLNGFRTDKYRLDLFERAEKRESEAV